MEVGAAFFMATKKTKINICDLEKDMETLTPTGKVVYLEIIFKQSKSGHLSDHVLSGIIGHQNIELQYEITEKLLKQDSADNYYIPWMEPNKKSKSDASELVFNHTSEEFMDHWHILVSGPKWRGKSTHALQLSVNKLNSVDEQTAIQMMKNAIERNWTGVFVPDEQINRTRQDIEV